MTHSPQPKKTEKIYIVSPKIKWKTFKLLQEKLVTNNAGPVPVNFDKVVWEMLREKRIYCWFDPNMPGDMKMGTELPKDKSYFELNSP